jgi:flap endonuclease-1
VVTLLFIPLSLLLGLNDGYRWVRSNQLPLLRPTYSSLHSFLQDLAKLISDEAPDSVKENKYESYFGRKIAVDASMFIYSFLAVVGRQGQETLTTETGEDTSHVLGMFYRATRMLEEGIKPIFVFEGKPPELKKEELAKRSAKREGANVELQRAIDSGDKEAIEKFSKRTIKVTPQHNEDCKQLLKLMGIPVFDAPSEAEAQCAQLCRENIVYAVSTEDMDTLTLGSPVLLRKLMAPKSNKEPVLEYNHAKLLEELGLTNDEFIDLCILCGCDYAERIPGIGPKNALKLIKEYKSIDAIIEHLNLEEERKKKKDEAKSNPKKIPDNYPYREARELFKNPEVLKGEDVPQMKWTKPDEEGLVEFLVKGKNFDETRVRNALKRIAAAKGKASQGRLESFFGPATTVKSTMGLKRKAEEKSKKGAKGAAKAKKGKLGKIGGKR